MDIQFAQLSSEAQTIQIISFLPTVECRSHAMLADERQLPVERQTLGICMVNGRTLPFAASQRDPGLIYVMYPRQDAKWLDRTCINYETASKFKYKVKINNDDPKDIAEVADICRDLPFPIIQGDDVVINISTDSSVLVILSEQVRFVVLHEAWRAPVTNLGLRTPLHSNGPSLVMRSLIADDSITAHDYNTPLVYINDIVKFLTGSHHIDRGKDKLILNVISRLAGGSGGRCDKQLPYPFDLTNVKTLLHRRGDLVDHEVITDAVMASGTSMYMDVRLNLDMEPYFYKRTNDDLELKDFSFSVYKKNSASLTRAKMIISLFNDTSISTELLILDTQTVREMSQLCLKFYQMDGLMSAYKPDNIPDVFALTRYRAVCEALMMNEKDALKFGMLGDLGLLDFLVPRSRLEACIVLGLASGRLA